MGSNRKSPKVKSGEASPQHTKLKRLLVVEDNNLNRLMLDDYLVFCGYQVLSLACGAKFFEELAAFQPHLILLDLKLPDIDGYSILEQLQNDSQWQNIPVIIVSAFAFKADSQRALNLGARQYFIKPVNLNDLSQAISQELNKWSN
ncbi:response regulator [Synechocystis sp. PCC 7509]|uniref:response regulator n=1 Tax=Synechocystis sp. PCC 7509 TaxID=927677 RepID=UPI0002AC6A74|nr:response regulator [Synechocystis sp. PCC 7509]